MEAIIDIQKTGSDGSMKGKFINKNMKPEHIQMEQEQEDLFKELGVRKIC